jgi:pyrimidine operon attenuation protein/uracil phosphoribosyltransferase
MQAKIQIINNTQVKAIIKRLAFQIWETHTHTKSLVIAGIAGNGQKIATLLANELSQISTLKIKQVEIHLSKHKPDVNEVLLDQKLATGDKHILVVDDVLNSGQTLLYALTPFVRAKVASIHTAVLMARSHRKFPVGADYIGMALSTTMQEHIDVVINGGKVSVYLE